MLFMKINKVVLSVILISLLSILSYFSFELIQKGKEAKIYKSDYAELHSVRYGMFNSNRWMLKVTEAIEQKIDSFSLNMDSRKEIEGYVSTILDTLIKETERIVRERNRKGDSFFDNILGSTREMIMNSLIDFKELRKRIPEFTESIMVEIEKEENQKRAKKILKEKVKAFMHSEFEVMIDMRRYHEILSKYKEESLEGTTIVLDQKIQEHRSIMSTLMFKILLLSLLIVLLLLSQNILTSMGLLILSTVTLILLILGLMLPMLDIEAKIIKLSFIILNYPVFFENQILFFQSKSIIDLVSLLLKSGEGKMIFVGSLLVMFSIIFPILKLIATTLYFYSLRAIKDSLIIRFFALHSTKWSMADVMVVSIFMAYLGLDGVVESELDKLQTENSSVNIITFNGTHLEVGFFLFLGFIFVSFVLSYMIKKGKVER